MLFRSDRYCRGVCACVVLASLCQRIAVFGRQGVIERISGSPPRRFKWRRTPCWLSLKLSQLSRAQLSSLRQGTLCDHTSTQRMEELHPKLLLHHNHSDRPRKFDLLPVTTETHATTDKMDRRVNGLRYPVATQTRKDDDSC